MNALEEYEREVARALSQAHDVGTLPDSTIYKLEKRKRHQKQNRGTRYFAHQKSAEDHMREEIYRDIFQAIRTNSNPRYVHGDILGVFDVDDASLVEPNWESIRKDFYRSGVSEELRNWFLNDDLNHFESLARWHDYATVSTKTLSDYSYEIRASKVSPSIIPEEVHDLFYAFPRELYQDGIPILEEILLGKMHISSVLNPEIEEAISIALILGTEFEAIPGTFVCVVNSLNDSRHIPPEVERCFARTAHAEAYALLLSFLHVPLERAPWKVEYSPEDSWADILRVNAYLTKHPGEMKYREMKYREIATRRRHESQISATAEWMQNHSYADLIDFSSAQEKRDSEDIFIFPRYAMREYRIEEDFVLTEDHLLAIESTKYSAPRRR